MKFDYWKFAVTFFFFLRFAQNSVLPKVRYFRITDHIFVVKKKKPTYGTYPLPKLWVGLGETEIFLIVV